MRECAFFGVTVSPVVVVLSDSGRVRKMGRDVGELNMGTEARRDSDVPDVERLVVVVAFRSGLSFEAESEGRDSRFERERESDDEGERRS